MASVLLTDVSSQVLTKLFTVKTLTQAGLIRPMRPDRLLRTAQVLAKWGPTPAAGWGVSAIRYPDEPGIVDELGVLTFAEVQRRSNGLARALQERGIGVGDGVAIMCRNHRGFVDATIACSKVGADVLFLNTMFAGPQIKEVCEREAPKAVVYDEEFAELVGPALEGRQGFVGWSDGENPHGHELLEELIEGGDPSELDAPSERGRVVILTSGTTGTPKGASRQQPHSLDPAAALFDRIPLRARDRMHIAAPMFHSWGFLHFTLGMALSSTMVLRRRFTPEGMLNAVAEHRCETLAVVPVMLQRTLELPPEVLTRYDVSSLRTIDASGSALPGETATRVMDVFGDVLYNLYGSTEVAWATIATPADMRAAPGTAGRPPHGTVLRIVGEDGLELPAGQTGRIFVGNAMAMEGYTGGGGKDELDGLLSTGDVGHIDADGRLFVDGRDDEMIVSGGENLFPREVEDLLSDHPGVKEAAVIGVEDEEFGQRLKAFVVLCDGEQLDEAALKAYVKENLASFKVPREVVLLDELPRNATGKVLKRELAKA